MRQWTSILLLLLLAWQTVFKAGFIIYWKINQVYITQAFCENKNKPQMHCNGKCYLSKQLKKTDENDNKEIPNSILKLKLFDPFVLQNHKGDFDYDSFLLKKIIPLHGSSILLTGHQNPLFKPPQFILV